MSDETEYQPDRTSDAYRLGYLKGAVSSLLESADSGYTKLSFFQRRQLELALAIAEGRPPYDVRGDA